MARAQTMQFYVPSKRYAARIEQQLVFLPEFHSCTAQASRSIGNHWHSLCSSNDFETQWSLMLPTSSASIMSSIFLRFRPEKSRGFRPISALPIDSSLKSSSLLDAQLQVPWRDQPNTNATAGNETMRDAQGN